MQKKSEIQVIQRIFFHISVYLFYEFNSFANSYYKYKVDRKK